MKKLLVFLLVTVSLFAQTFEQRYGLLQPPSIFKRLGTTVSTVGSTDNVSLYTLSLGGAIIGTNALAVTGTITSDNSIKNTLSNTYKSIWKTSIADPFFNITNWSGLYGVGLLYDGDFKIVGYSNSTTPTTRFTLGRDTGNATFAGTLYAPNGSAASPSYTFTSDPNSGMYSVGADQLGLSVNGSNMVTVTTTGVGIGAQLTQTQTTTIPAGQLINQHQMNFNVSGVSSDLTVQGTRTLGIQTSLSGTYDMGTISGVYAVTTNNSTAGTVTHLIGTLGTTQNADSGTVDKAYAVYGRVDQSGVGHINNAYGLYSNSPLFSGGTIDNYFGVGALTGSMAGANVTNAYGAFFQTPSGATGNNIGLIVGGAPTGVNNLAAFFDGAVKMNSTLDVASIANLTGGIYMSSGAISTAGVIQILNKASSGWVSIATRNTAGDEAVYDLTNIGTITTTGNVGIATTNPLATFHDNGTAMFGAGTGASLTDSSLVINYTTGSPVVNWYGTDGDTWNLGINTSDYAVFSGAILYSFDNGITLADAGTSANSFALTLTADNATTPQYGSIQVMYGADPYLRISAPNDAGVATAILDLKDQRVVIGAGTDGVDYDIFGNGFSSQGTITFMEDEDRWDFDNDIKVGASLWGSAQMSGTDAFTTTATADTATVTGATVNDIYILTYITAVTAAEAPLSVTATATGFIATRPAGTTSGASYAWMRQRK